MTYEEKREKKRAAERRRYANLTDEQREKQREKKAVYDRDRYANLTDEQREKRDDAERRWRTNMTDEQRKRKNAARRRWQFKKNGITSEQYDRQFEAQDGRCAICGRHHTECLNGRLVPDHDHETGELRGLLCHKENRSLGLFGDNLAGLLKPVKYLIGGDPERLAMAISYLKRKSDGRPY